jgi:hypothetical protein
MGCQTWTEGSNGRVTEHADEALLRGKFKEVRR